MVIRFDLVVLDKDLSFLQRFTDYVSKKHGDRIGVHAFSKEDAFLRYMENEHAEIALIADGMDVDVEKLGASGVLILSERKTNEANRVFKYQAADLIYKEILSAYAEVSGGSVTDLSSMEGTKVLSFISYGSGSGTSTVAAACAMYLAEQNQKVLYLDLQKLASVGCFFTGDGKYCLSDVMFAIMSHKTDIKLKLESMVKRDSSGVYFYDSFKNVLEHDEMKTENLVELLNALSSSGGYDYILIDYDFSFDESFFEVLKCAVYVVTVTDSSQVSEKKLNTMVEALGIAGRQMNTQHVNKLHVFFNKFSAKNSSTAKIFGVHEEGNIQLYPEGTAKQIAERMANQNAVAGMFKRIDR